MANRAQVQELMVAGHTFESAARKLDIAPGEAYLIATGRPADGSDGRWFDGSLPNDLTRPQELVGPPAHNPLRRPEVDAWIRERAARELTERELTG